MIFKKKLILLIFLILVLQNTFAQTYSQSKTINKGYKINSATNVEIKNKYGDIKIYESNSDSVNFEIKVYAESASQERLNDLINGVTFKFNSTNYYLNVETIFDADKNLFSDFKKITDIFITTENIIEVDYIVYMPANLNLKIENKYGNVTIDNFTNNFNLILENGNFKAKDLSGTSTLDFNFCESIEINSLSTSSITLNYSNLKIDDVQQLTLNSKSGDIKIDKINILNIISKRDKFKIGNINNLYGETYFTDFDVKELNQEVSLNLKYGEAEFEKILKNFNLVDFTSLSADIGINLEVGSSFAFDLSENKTNLKLNEKILKIERKFLTSGSSTISGKIGTSEKAKIKLNLNGGSLTIDFK